jgi:O-methyltransferase involved in polyketide biosynthesis
MMQTNDDRPHVGRVYDYVLGGQHNFPVDRQAAARIMEVLPAYPKWAQLNRRFLQWVADQWAAAGQRYVIDLGSGLPTQGHLHERMPEAQILYSDNDPLCVTAGGELVAHLPNVAYVQADLCDADQVLKAAADFFPAQPQVAIDFIGVTYLLDDEQLTSLGRRLHAWAAPGSVMAVSFLQRDLSPNGRVFAEELQQRLEQMGITVYYRTPAQISTLLAPWQLVEARPLEQWIGQVDSVTSEDRVQDLFWMSGALLTHG